MKTRFTQTTGAILTGLLWTVALGALPLSVCAAEPPTHLDFRATEYPSSVIGLKVRDYNDQALGTVLDLALDMEGGRVVEVIVGARTFLGLGQRVFAVPPGALMFDPGDHVFRINTSKSACDASPEFVMSKWEDECQSRRVAVVYHYYGEEPYFAADGQESRSGNTAREPLGHVERCTRLLEIPVKNLQNETLGKVSTFLFDLPSGRITHVIVASDNTRVVTTKSVIPATGLRFDATHRNLVFDVSLQEFSNQPRFRWIYGSGGGFQQETYANAKITANDGVNTRQNVREGSATTYTALKQGVSFADIDLTYRIYTAMRADATLSQNAQNVEVGSMNGRVTVRGHVNTEEGKAAIGKIAAGAGRPENVSNLLEVRPLPVVAK